VPNARTRWSRLGILALTVALVVAMSLVGPVQAKKKKKGKKKGPSRVDITRTVNQPIPDGSGTAYGVVTSTINVGKKFKGKRIRDVNVTIHTSGTPPSTIAAGDITARLFPPNGARVTLVQSLSGISIGPLTLDDESPRELGGSSPSPDPDLLLAPYIGSAQPEGRPLSVMDDGPARGVWTLKVYDHAAADLSTFNSWRLTVQVGPPYKTK